MRAIAAAAGFSLIGFFALLIYGVNAPEVLPDVLFYAILVIHTYFSVRFFSTVIPQNLWQIVTDLALVVVYCALALSFGNGFRFISVALCLFAVAIFKYVPSLSQPHLNALMSRKIKYLLGGVSLAIYSLIIAFVANDVVATWFFVVIYTYFTYIILLIERMYGTGDVSK